MPSWVNTESVTDVTGMVRSRSATCGLRSARSRAISPPSTKAVLVVIARVITRLSVAGSKGVGRTSGRCAAALLAAAR